MKKKLNYLLVPFTIRKKLTNMNSYVEEFLKMKASGDILGISHPVQQISKEISESMAIFHVVKKLWRVREKTIYDFCAGNALSGLINLFLLKPKKVVAIDIAPRVRHFEMAKNFEYLFEDINLFDPSRILPYSIIISSHPCKQLAKTIIDIFNRSSAKCLVLNPCCSNKIDIRIPKYFQETSYDKYAMWAYSLYSDIQCQHKDFFEDKNIISPKNIIITATKTEDEINQNI
jgi:hypothetical protein